MQKFVPLHYSLLLLLVRGRHSGFGKQTEQNRESIPSTALQHYSTTGHDLDLPGRADRYNPDLYDQYDLYDLYALAHVAGWEPYGLHDLGRVSWI